MAETMVNGVRIAYELSGELDVGTPKAPIILLNGVAMSISHWKQMIAALPAGTRCLCHDFRGQTLSGKPAGPYSLAMHAGDLAALMDALHMEKGHIVGTSYGSEVAMEFALLYPERCASLMLIDGVSELDPVLEAAVSSWMESAQKDARLFYKTMLPWTYSPNYIAAHRDMLAAREESVAALPAEWFSAFVELCNAFLKIDLTPRLKYIQCTGAEGSGRGGPFAGGLRRAGSRPRPAGPCESHGSRRFGSAGRSSDAQRSLSSHRVHEDQSDGARTGP